MQYINVKVKSTIKWHGRTIHAVDGKILQPVWFLFENYSQKIKNYRDKNFNCIPNYTTMYHTTKFKWSFDMRRDEETNVEKNYVNSIE